MQYKPILQTSDLFKITEISLLKDISCTKTEVVYVI